MEKISDTVSLDKRDDIAVILWNNVYFKSKYGDDEEKLEEEIFRILSKMEPRDE